MKRHSARTLRLMICCLSCFGSAQGLTQGGLPGERGGGEAKKTEVPSNSKGDANEVEGYRHLWEARMQGGNYLVLVNKISFVSKHEYVSDGVARVVEVTIASAGAAVARFYYLEPVTEGSSGALSGAQNPLDKIQSLGKEGARRAGLEDQLFDVVKNYPATTHARTVEYRLRSEGAVDSLYRNLARTMASGKGRVFRESEEE